MNGTIIKFDALPYANRTGAEYDNFFVKRSFYLIFLRVISRIVVRRDCLKFRRAGVNHFVIRENFILETKFTDFLFRTFSQLGNGFIGKSQKFCGAYIAQVEIIF